MKITLFLAVVLIVVGLGGNIAYMKFGSKWHATAKSETALFVTEHDAAFAGSQSIQTSAPISRLQQGERVAVLWDTYGKDYWACWVRTASGQRGWLLCTNLQRA